ncbi:MAG TPA: nicotinate phosphoribosyltransferase [Candidatus Binatia bacterium]|nr:nicotinate phosphoribosyltransferase [Candidatus Binatia bacterium]
MTWVNDSNAPLLTDLYQLKMLQAYFEEEMEARATFDLFVRQMPPTRNFLVACGLDDALDFLETLSFDAQAIAHLARFGQFSTRFLDWLSRLRFTGDVFAVPEGTALFAAEPILEVVAPLPQAQLVETFLTNQVHLQTVLASKAARIVMAAGGRTIVDFGLRRTHGADAGLKAARSLFIAGVSATSNVLAGALYGIPVAGTMAHSYVQAHDDERSAFRRFIELYPDTVVLVDTYDTHQGVRTVVDLAGELGERFRVSAVRLDSGDLEALASAARKALDEAGLQRVKIFASGGLDEHSVAALVARGAPIDGFGVGTRMGVSEDAPALDMVYKLVDYGGRGRTKLSPAKQILPGPKQVFRTLRSGEATGDLIAAADESFEGRPMLIPVMRGGRRLPQSRETLEAARERARKEIAELPVRVRGLESADPPYSVDVSARLRDEQAGLTALLRPR